MSHPWLTTDCLLLPMALNAALLAHFTYVSVNKATGYGWCSGCRGSSGIKKKKKSLRLSSERRLLFAPHSYHPVSGRLTSHKKARKINNAYSRVEPRCWQGHRSMLFPAFAKIPNSPYLIKRPLCCGWFTTPAVFMSTCFIFFSLLWHLKWWEFYAFDNNMSFTLDQNSWPCQQAINNDGARNTTKRPPARI